MRAPCTTTKQHQQNETRTVTSQQSDAHPWISAGRVSNAKYTPSRVSNLTRNAKHAPFRVSNLMRTPCISAEESQHLKEGTVPSQQFSAHTLHFRGRESAPQRHTVWSQQSVAHTPDIHAIVPGPRNSHRSKLALPITIRKMTFGSGIGAHLGRCIYGYREKRIQTPMAQGRSTNII